MGILAYFRVASTPTKYASEHQAVVIYNFWHSPVSIFSDGPIVE